jgi:hypothetical protein
VDCRTGALYASPASLRLNGQEFNIGLNCPNSEELLDAGLRLPLLHVLNAMEYMVLFFTITLHITAPVQKLEGSHAHANGTAEHGECCILTPVTVSTYGLEASTTLMHCARGVDFVVVAGLRKNIQIFKNIHTHT